MRKGPVGPFFLLYLLNRGFRVFELCDIFFVDRSEGRILRGVECSFVAGDKSVECLLERFGFDFNPECHCGAPM